MKEELEKLDQWFEELIEAIGDPFPRSDLYLEIKTRIQRLKDKREELEKLLR